MGGRQVGLDLGGAEIHGDFEERNPPIALPNQRLDSSLLALDIGGIANWIVGSFGGSKLDFLRCEFVASVVSLGTLIKLVYFSDGLLHFVKFERRRLHECFDFIRSKNLISGKGMTFPFYLHLISSVIEWTSHGAILSAFPRKLKLPCVILLFNNYGNMRVHHANTSLKRNSIKLF